MASYQGLYLALANMKVFMLMDQSVVVRYSKILRQALLNIRIALYYLNLPIQKFKSFEHFK